MVIRVSKQEASARLQVSLSTVNRRIEDGELEVEYETHGRSHRVWVLLPDTADAPGDETDGIPAVPDNAAGDMAGMSEAAAVEVAILRERCARFEELSEYRGKLLVEADARTQWLIGGAGGLPAHHRGLGPRPPARAGTAGSPGNAARAVGVAAAALVFRARLPENHVHPSPYRK